MAAQHRGGLATWILVGMVLGLIAGLAVDATWGAQPEAKKVIESIVGGYLRPLGGVFISLIFMVVMPLIFSAIVLGVLEMGDLKKLGNTGLKCLGVTILLAGTGVVIGLTLVNLVGPGRMLDEAKREELRASQATSAATVVQNAQSAKPPVQAVVDLIPRNPLYEASMAFVPGYTGAGVIGVMVFSLLFGVALLSLEATRREALANVCQGLFDVSLKLISYAMLLAPVCVGLLTFSVAATLGLGVVQSLGVYVLVVLGGLALHMFGSYSVFLYFFAKRNPVTFFLGMREAMVTAFSTSSSNATLPISLRVAEENLGLPRQISRFVLTVGASANQNGTALYEGVTVLFLAQVYGIDLNLGQQVAVALMCIIAGIGTAGVPGGSLPLVVGVLITMQIPAEAIAIIIGIDRFLDMCRTTLNVAGDLVCAAMVAGPQPAVAEPTGAAGSGGV